MKLIVGLGNPDKEYLNTFHNLGFMAVDKACEKLDLAFNKTKCKAVIAEDSDCTATFIYRLSTLLTSCTV